MMKKKEQQQDLEKQKLQQEAQEYKEKAELQEMKAKEYQQMVKEEEKKVMKYNKENQKLKDKIAVYNVWQWQKEDGTWHDYDRIANDAIEKLLTDKTYQYTFTGNNQTYAITKLSDDTAEQINIKTHKRRKARRTQKQRVDDIDDMKYPEWWDMRYIDAEYGKTVLIELDLSTSPGKDVVNNFKKTCPYTTVVKVESVQSQMLYDKYLSARHFMIKLVGENNLNERDLYHGTKQIDVMKKVYTEGFMKVFNRAAAYGEGTYFARDASYSADGYCGYDGNTGTYQMFQCKVITGQSHQGSGNYKLTTWPKKANDLKYDSLVDDVSNPSIFVIHENGRTYPMFIIHFK